MGCTDAPKAHIEEAVLAASLSGANKAEAEID